MNELKEQYNAIALKQWGFLEQMKEYRREQDGTIFYDIPPNIQGDMSFTKKEADRILGALALAGVYPTADEIFNGFKEGEQ